MTVKWYNEIMGIRADVTKITIDELCERTGTPRRTVRYYIAEGLLPPPAGRGRGGFYDAAHIAQLTRIRALRATGHTLQTIRAMLAGATELPPEGITATMLHPPLAELREVRAVYRIAPGVELSVRRDAEEHDPSRIQELLRIARTLFPEGTTDLP